METLQSDTEQTEFLLNKFTPHPVRELKTHSFLNLPLPLPDALIQIPSVLNHQCAEPESRVL